MIALRKPLAVLLAALAAVWSFSELSEAALGLEPRGFDERLLLLLREAGDLADPLGPAWLEQALRDITSLGSLTVVALVSLLAALALLRAHRPLAAVSGWIAVGTAEAASMLLKVGYARPRPDLVAHEVEVTTASFPSGHAMLAAVAYLTWALLLTSRQEPRARTLALALALVLTAAIGSSRVYLGVHWPTDVLAGWVIGGSWAITGYWLVRRLETRG